MLGPSPHPRRAGPLAVPTQPYSTMGSRFLSAYYLANAALLAAYGAAKLLHARNGEAAWGMIRSGNLRSWVRAAIGRPGRRAAISRLLDAPDIEPAPPLCRSSSACCRWPLSRCSRWVPGARAAPSGRPASSPGRGDDRRPRRARRCTNTSPGTSTLPTSSGMAR
jgi:hypothetical protein